LKKGEDETPTKHLIPLVQMEIGRSQISGQLLKLGIDVQARSSKTYVLLLSLAKLRDGVDFQVLE
jgi:hypothetical protein